MLFSGQNALGPRIAHASGYTAEAIVLLLACNGLGYSLSMSSFRGGPVFPSLLLGAAAGIACVGGLRLAPASWPLPGKAQPPPASPAAGDVAARPGRNDGTARPQTEGGTA